MSNSTAVLAVAAIAAVTILILRREYRMSNQESADQITAQLRKVGVEFTTKIDELEAKVAAGEPVDFTELRGVAQQLDDIVPDAPAETPDETPVEGEQSP
jgi:hypothetical protein